MLYFKTYREKNALEGEVTQYETQHKLKGSEIKSIQNEIETMHQMIKQLETQKIEARKRLADMDVQVQIIIKLGLITLCFQFN